MSVRHVSRIPDSRIPNHESWVCGRTFSLNMNLLSESRNISKQLPSCIKAIVYLYCTVEQLTALGRQSTQLKFLNMWSLSVQGKYCNLSIIVLTYEIGCCIQAIAGNGLGNVANSHSIVRTGFCHSPVDFCAHAHTYARILPRTSTRTTAHTRTHSCTLPHMLMHAYRRENENDKSQFYKILTYKEHVVARSRVLIQSGEVELLTGNSRFKRASIWKL